MFLFLEGVPRVGKSTILRNALLPHRQAVAGLMVQRLFEEGQMCGFRACVVDGEDLPDLEGPYSDELEGVFLYKGKTRPGVLEATATRAAALCAGEACKLVILDEIGGFELSSPAFTQPMDTILRLGKPCLGVIKSRENLAHTVANLGLPHTLLVQNEELHRRIGAQGRVLRVTGDNLAAIAQAVEDFVLAAKPGH